MKIYERVRLLQEPFLQSHYYFVRHALQKIVAFYDDPLILDVGGRESPYTIGIKASIILSELPRENSIQEELNLGLTSKMEKHLHTNRSNIQDVIIDDMTSSQLSSNHFDCVVAVEVLEHVLEDTQFIQEVHRVLKPDGIFLMTTPNGDYIENTNPDHQRHYKRKELEDILNTTFSSVKCIYGVRTGTLLSLGWIKKFSPKRPIRTFFGGIANAINLIISTSKDTKHKSQGTAHIFAVASKVASQHDLDNVL